jgi:hypothetical protein
MMNQLGAPALAANGQLVPQLLSIKITMRL